MFGRRRSTNRSTVVHEEAQEGLLDMISSLSLMPSLHKSGPCPTGCAYCPSRTSDMLGPATSPGLFRWEPQFWYLASSLNLLRDLSTRADRSFR